MPKKKQKQEHKLIEKSNKKTKVPQSSITYDKEGYEQLPPLWNDDNNPPISQYPHYSHNTPQLQQSFNVQNNPPISLYSQHSHSNPQPQKSLNIQNKSPKPQSSSNSHSVAASSQEDQAMIQFAVDRAQLQAQHDALQAEFGKLRKDLMFGQYHQKVVDVQSKINAIKVRIEELDKRVTKLEPDESKNQDMIPYDGFYGDNGDFYKGHEQLLLGLSVVFGLVIVIGAICLICFICILGIRFIMKRNEKSDDDISIKHRYCEV